MLDTAGDLLRALAAPVRIAIVLQLRESARCVHELVDALGVPQPLVSQHLRILKAAGVVAGERTGREVLYRLVDHHLAHIVVAAVTHAAEDTSDVRAPGVRATRQRAAISALLENIDDFRSAQDLHDELRRRGEGIGLTTVYRTLQSMATAGLVDTLRTDTGESVYRRCSEHHHHHLVCRVCGCTVEVQGGQVETWAQTSHANTASPMSATPSRSSASAAAARRTKLGVTDQLTAHIGARAEHHHDQRLQRLVGQAGGRESCSAA